MDALSICDAQRTPIGRFGRPHLSWAVPMIFAAGNPLLQFGWPAIPDLDWSKIDGRESLLRHISGPGEDNRKWHVWQHWRAGFDRSMCPVQSIKPLCGLPVLDAVGAACPRDSRQGDIGSGDCPAVVESIGTRAPFVMPKAETAFLAQNNRRLDTTHRLALCKTPKMKAQYGGRSMPETGD